LPQPDVNGAKHSRLATVREFSEIVVSDTGRNHE